MKYSLVVPIYNDGALAADFCRETERVFRERLGVDDIANDVELIFVDDGSRNESLKALKAAATKFSFAKIVALSRNFGQHIAISCGYRHTRGALVAYLNVDQEDPPDQILVVADALEANNWDIACGIYSHRDVPLMNKLTSRLFPHFLNWLTGYETPVNGSVLRVMNRTFIDAYNGLTEKSRYIPGLERWLGYAYGHVAVTHRRRRDGGSTYNFRRRLRLAIDSIISFSDFPLRLAVKVGFTITVLGSVLATAIVVDKLFFRDILPGYASTLAAIVFFGGAQIFVTGVASLYIGRILAEVQGRPLYVIRERIGDLPDPDRRAS